MLRNRVLRVRIVQTCAMLSSNVFDFPILRNRVFRFRKVKMSSDVPQGFWLVDAQELRIELAKRLDMGIATWKDFDLLIIRNRVLRLGNVHVWVVSLFYVVNLLMLRNRVLRLRIVQKWVMLSWNCWCSGFAYSGCETFVCGSSVMKGLRFADSQESRFLASNRSNMGSTVLLGGRSANIQEFCFQAAKRSDMVCAELQGGLFADCQYGIFRLRYVRIRAVPSCKRVDLLML